MKALCIKKLDGCTTLLCTYPIDTKTVLRHYPDGTPYESYSMLLDCCNTKVHRHFFPVEKFDEYFRMIPE